MSFPLDRTIIEKMTLKADADGKVGELRAAIARLQAP